MRFWSYITLFSLLLAPQFAGAQGYDEVFDGDQVRPQYKKYWEIYSKLTEKQKKEFAEKSFKDFKGDNALSPLPRVMTAEETQTLRAGVEQRARALQAFLMDHYSGAKEYIKAKVVPESAVVAALRRSHETGLPNFSNGEGFNFWYGPDVIRDPNGIFRVVEDNLGFIGGMGDLNKARESLVKNIPAYKPLVKNTADPNNFYQRIAARYKEIAAEKGGEPLLIMYMPKLASDTEDQRVRKIFKDNGIRTFAMRKTNTSKTQYLEMKSDGMYFFEKDAKTGKMSKTKIGHVVLNMEPQDIDYLYEKNYDRHLFAEKASVIEGTGLKKSEIKDLIDTHDPKEIETWLKTKGKKIFGETGLERTGYEGFWKLAESGKMSVTNALGSEFINDKAFYPYVENLVRHYLKEEPIIRNIETYPLAVYDKNGVPHLNEAVVKKTSLNPADWVTKGATGRGGDAVFIGKKMSPAEHREVVRKFRENPDNFIIQRYTALPTKDGNIVDNRMICDVSNKGVIVADVSWGREISKDGSGKVNLSIEGVESVVLSELPVMHTCPTYAEVLQRIFKKNH